MDPLVLIEEYLSDQENSMKNLIAWSLNQAMLQEAPSRQEPPHNFPSIPRKRNAIVTEKTLPRCSMKDMLKSSVCEVGPGCGNALRM